MAPKDQDLKLFPGTPEPLGPSERINGVNFAVYSKHADGVTLYLEMEETGEVQEIELNRRINKTGDVWHICVKGTNLAPERKE